MAPEPCFTRMKNPDSTIDSICEHCYKTVAKDRDEQALATAEGTHSCDPNLMLDRLSFSRRSTY